MTTILIGLYIFKEAYEIVKKTVHILMEGTPHDMSLPVMKETLEKIPGVRDVHHVHVWSVGEHDHHMEAHIRVDDMPVSAADEIRAHAEQILRDRFNIGHVTLQVEHRSCPDVGLIKQQSHA